MELYQPSNGTELMMFTENFCDKCLHDSKFRRTHNDQDACDIMGKMFYLDADEPGYPKELMHDAEGHPTCTAFVDESKAVEIANEAPMKKREAKGQGTLFWGEK